MRIIIALSITIEPDGQLRSTPLGYTVRDAQGGGYPTPDELEELKRRILARGTSGGGPSASVAFTAAMPPLTKPERSAQTPLVPRAAPSSVAAAEAALVALGFDAEAADRAVVRHGAKRVQSVATWARNRMTAGDVKDPVKLIESCLARPPVER